MIEVNLLGAITTTEVFLEQLKTGGDIVNLPRSPDAPPTPETAATPPPNGA